MIGPEHWQPLFGRFDFAPDLIRFTGEEPALGEMTGYPSGRPGLAMSDADFGGGSITAEVRWDVSARFPAVHLVTYRDPADGSSVSAGIESGGGTNDNAFSRFVIRRYDGTRTADRAYIVAQTSPVPRSLAGGMTLTVSQSGSVVDLYADGVHVLRNLLPVSDPVSQCGIYCEAIGTVDVPTYTVATHRRTAFVVMQFGTPYDQLYTDVIKPVVAKCGFDVIRADEDFGPNLIIADVVRRIQEAEVIIADITPENQNVFYEVGYAHALGKPTILLAEKGKRLPFDVSGFRTLFYENSIAGKAAVEQGLRRHVEAITRERPAALAV